MEGINKMAEFLLKICLLNMALNKKLNKYICEKNEEFFKKLFFKKRILYSYM